MSSLHGAVLLAFFIAATRLFSREPKTDINVNVTLTEAGKKIDRPTREKPAYYRAIAAGFLEEGDLDAHEKRPDPDKVVQMLKKSLAAQGYLESTSDQISNATLLLVFYWGYANPLVDEDNHFFINKEAMVGLVSGQESQSRERLQ